MSDVSPAHVAESRSATYWMLSGLFLERPGEGAWTALRGQLEAVARSAGGTLPAAFERLRRGAGERAAAALAVEYTRLFGGLRPGHGPPPPFESVHRESRLMGEVTLAVTRAYAEAGFAAVCAEAGPQDHLGAELRFMSLACHEELSSWRADDREAAVGWLVRERDFLDRHLLRWVPAYCAALAASARAPFYEALAVLTGQVVADDRALVGTLLGDRAA